MIPKRIFINAVVYTCVLITLISLVIITIYPLIK
jgi:hypothetical protein